MNSIGKIALNLKGENEAFFRTLYGNWDSFYMKNIERPTDDILMQFDDSAIEFEISSLELDLGYISEENFAEEFTALYKEKLAEILQSYIYDTHNENVKRVSKTKRLSEMLCYFLRYGSLPWNIDEKYKDINLLFLEVVQKEGAVLKKFLLTYGHYTSLQQRLVFQLHDKSLKEGVKLIAPGESTFITSYVRFLQSKYKQIERPVIKESVHRNVVWQVVYAYLLNNKSSFFNKKAFIKYTIKSLSASHNLSYGQLFKIIAAELERSYRDAKTTSELFIILSQLKNEIPKDVLEGSVSDIAKCYKIFSGASQKNQPEWTTNRKVLEDVLRREDSCRQFLHYLNEAEIIKLVKIVVPNDHGFVVSYAKSLDRQKEKGALQGKAGGEFRIVKWQIIFPILLESNTNGFNRKYFVLRTLKRVAAHYNLDIKDILTYFLTNEKERVSLDANLTAIFEQLFTEFSSTSESTTGVFISDYKVIAARIRSVKELTEDEVIEWKKLLQAAEFRERVLGELKDETEHSNFISILFPHQSRIIIAYAKSLDVYQKKKALEGKTGGKFMQMKWKFIHAVLFEPQQQVFNKKYFVSRILVRIAAHYNLKMEELVLFFYKEIIKPGNVFPFELVKVLKELYEEQVKVSKKKEMQALKNAEASQPEERAKKRLAYYFGNDSELAFYIESLAKEYEFIAFIEEALKTEMALRRYAIDELGITPNTKQLLQLLMRFSKEYHSQSRTVIMARIIMVWMDSIKIEGKRRHFENKLTAMAKTNKLIKETLASVTEFTELILTDAENETKKDRHTDKAKDEILKEEKVSSFVSNAGLVLLWPYLARLFEMQSLTEDNRFKDDEARIKAMFVMQYAVFGLTEFPEHELELNKLLTGIQPGVAIPLSVELTQEEKHSVDGLLTAVIQNWSKLGNTSIDGLRGNFLIRNGKLEEHEDFYQLTVEEKAYDILLGSLPWSISTFKLSWMEKGINVKWR